jgi:hypothetical protein
MQPHTATDGRAWMTRWESLLARCEADASLHMTGGGCPEPELRRIEEAIGYPLPVPYRLFLGRLGGGVYYLKHEIFGCRRVMTHDIELVPDVLSFRRWLGDMVSRNALPFHRADGRIHVLELSGDQAGLVRSIDEGGDRCSDFASFLEEFVVGR